MKRIATSVIFMLVLLVAGAANAQMMGPGGNRGGGGMPANGPNGLMNGGMAVIGGMTGVGNHRGLIVGTDGTVYTIRVSKPATAEPATFEVVAVRSSGTIAWTAPVNGGMTFMELSGENLLVMTARADFDRDFDDPPAPPTSSLVALSAASGSTQWTLQLDGFALDLTPFSGGTYVTVVKFVPSNNPGGNVMAPGSLAARTLVAVGNDGKVLWSVPLTR